MLDRIKSTLIVFLILSSSIVLAQDEEEYRNDLGVGIRFGAPSGVTVKKYLGTNALEAGVGVFYGSTLTAFVHYLFHRPIANIGEDFETDGLDWYYGFGAQMKSYRGFFDLAVDGVIGVEYTFSEVPLSIFLDIVGNVEIVDTPFLIGGAGGVGMRYNF